MIELANPPEYSTSTTTWYEYNKAFSLSNLFMSNDEHVALIVTGEHIVEPEKASIITAFFRRTPPEHKGPESHYFIDAYGNVLDAENIKAYSCNAVNIKSAPGTYFDTIHF